MRAMILAAGLGRRMLPLTQDTPKPMLEVAGRPLLEHVVIRLVEHGIREMVINHSYLGERVEDHFGDGRRWGAAIRYSPEGNAPLGTLAGIAKARHLLGKAPFVLVSADAWTDYPFSRLRTLKPGILAHLVLADNPAHHPGGDFALRGDSILAVGAPRYTYCGIGLCAPAVCDADDKALGPRLRQLAAAGRLTGEHYTGTWLDIGTPERLTAVRMQATLDKPRKQP